MRAAVTVQTGPVQGHDCSPYFLLRPHIQLRKCGLGKFILQEIFLHLVCILNYKPHIHGLDISLVIGNSLLFQYIGSKGQAGNQMSGAGSFLSSIRIHTAVCCPGLILCHYISAYIIDGQAILIIHSCFVVIDGLSIFIF